MADEIQKSAMESALKVMGNLPYQKTKVQDDYQELDEFTKIENETGTRIECLTFDVDNNDYAEKYMGKNRAEALEPRRHRKLQGLYGIAQTINNLLYLEELTGEKGVLEFSMSNEDEKLNIKAFLPGVINGIYGIIAVEQDMSEGSYDKQIGKQYMSISQIGMPGSEIDRGFERYLKANKTKKIHIAAPLSAMMNTMEGDMGYTKFETRGFTVIREGNNYTLYGPTQLLPELEHSSS